MPPFNICFKKNSSLFIWNSNLTGHLGFYLVSPSGGHLSHSPECRLIHWRVFIYQCCHNKVPETGWLKQKKLFFSYFWGLEVQDPGSQAGLVSYRVSLLGLQMAPFSLCLYMVFLLSLHVWCFCVLISTLYKDSSHFGLVSTLLTHFSLITSSKVMSPNTFWGFGVSGKLPYKFVLISGI